MELLSKFQNYIRNEKLFSSADKLLLAVSGGVDSVVLCDLCKKAGYDFDIAHCNFQLRGKESESDEKFVKRLAIKYNVTFFVKAFDTEKFASDQSISIQEAARKLRYEWFDEISSTRYTPRAAYILTAHHTDDNIETALMNFFKGTGIAGLRGILPRQGRIVRPLLFAKKEDLVAFAKEQKMEWTEDSSNLSDKYSRNYFRNQVIPLVKKIYPEAEANMANNLQRFADTEQLYRQAIDWHKKRLLEKKENEIHIPILKLKRSVPLRSIVYEIIHEFGFSPQQTEEVIDLLDSEPGKFIQSSSHRVINNRKWLIISPRQTVSAMNILIEAETNEVEFAKGKLNIEKVLKTDRYTIPDSAFIASLDAEKIQFPLLLRKWKQGDYFYPLGMKNLPAGKVGKKKLSRFFIDEKLSRTDKERAWVLEMDKKIIWVVGRRIDNRFKVNESTRSILKITLVAS